MLQGLLVENTQIVSAIIPIALDAGANAGDWVSMENYTRCCCVFFAAAGTAGDDPTITMSQATAAAGTGTKALNFTRVDTKQGTLTAVGTFTEVTQAAGNTYTDATSAEIQKIWLFDIDSADLDVANGFNFIQMSCDDPGTNAQIGCGLYVLYNCSYPQATPPQAIA